MEINKKVFKKNYESSSLFRKLYRNFGGWMATQFAKTSITPIQVGYMRLVMLSFTYYLIYYNHFFVGALVLYIAIALDYTDGSLARINNQVSKFGEWFDGASDNVGLVALLFFIGISTDVMVGCISIIISYLMCRSIFLLYKRIYQESADNVIEGVKKNQFISCLYYNELFILNGCVIFLLINRIEWFIWFCSIYGWLFYVAMLTIFTWRASK